MSVAYDTLKIAQRLTEAGLEPKTAQGVSATFAEVLAAREDSLVTKADPRQEMSVLRSELRADIRSASLDLINWKVGSQIAMAGILFAAIKLL